MTSPSLWLRRGISPQLRERLGRYGRHLRALFAPEPFRTVLPYTMVGLKRLRTLDELAHRIDTLGIPGDIVECGACNGGSGAILARVASQSAHQRRTWLLDSFAGLPAASSEDGDMAAEYTGLCQAHPANVKRVLRESGVPEEAVGIVPGWFQDTLPTLPVQQIALLHIDADWYDSVRICLELLYDKVVPGGFVVLDDYGYWEGCRKAWHEFEGGRGLHIDLIQVDGTGVYFQKPHAEASA